MDKKKFAAKESRLKLSSDWRRGQIIVTKVQKCRTLFDARTSVA